MTKRRSLFGPARLRWVAAATLLAALLLSLAPLGLGPIADRVALAQTGQPVPVNDTLLNRSFHGGAANVMLWQRATGFQGHGGFTGMLVIFAGLGTVTSALLRAWQRVQVQRIRRLMEPAATAPSESAGTLRRRRAEILSEVAVVDSRRAQGELGAEEHQRRREALKQELVAVLTHLKRLEG